LDPPHLGAVEMEVLMRGNRIQALLSADNDGVRQVLKDRVEEIKQVLADQGIKVERIDVRPPEEKSLPSWSGGEREEAERHERQGREQPPERDDPTVSFAQALNLSM